MDGTTPPNSNIGTIQGLVHGGRQAIAGAHIYLYAAGTGGYGGTGIAASAANSAASLLNASSGANPTTIDGMGTTTPPPDNSALSASRATTPVLRVRRSICTWLEAIRGPA